MTKRRPAPEPAAGAKSAPGRKVILVVDDQAVLRTILSHVLTQRGYQVLTAVNGLDAIQTIVAYPASIDVLITDLMMPIMGGEELLEYAAVLRPQMKAICLTATVTDVSLQRAVLTLPKPFSLEAIAGSVAGVLAVAAPDSPARAENPDVTRRLPAAQGL